LPARTSRSNTCSRDPDRRSPPLPAQIGYGQSFDITTPDAADISRVALIRPGSVTHAVDFDQRYVDMSSTIGSGVVTATAPSSGNAAPPGYYMLVVVNSPRHLTQLVG